MYLLHMSLCDTVVRSSSSILIKFSFDVNSRDISLTIKPDTVNDVEEVQVQCLVIEVV